MLLGKRYVDEESDIEVLCTKAGDGRPGGGRPAAGPQDGQAAPLLGLRPRAPRARPRHGRRRVRRPRGHHRRRTPPSATPSSPRGPGRPRRRSHERGGALGRLPGDEPPRLPGRPLRGGRGRRPVRPAQLPAGRRPAGGAARRPPRRPRRSTRGSPVGFADPDAVGPPPGLLRLAGRRGRPRARRAGPRRHLPAPLHQRDDLGPQGGRAAPPAPGVLPAAARASSAAPARRRPPWSASRRTTSPAWPTCSPTSTPAGASSTSTASTPGTWLPTVRGGAGDPGHGHPDHAGPHRRPPRRRRRRRHADPASLSYGGSRMPAAGPAPGARALRGRPASSTPTA